MKKETNEEINKEVDEKEENEKEEGFDFSEANTITDETMTNLLLELAESKYWPAILRYVSQRLELTANSLFSLDPFKNPTETARSQGIRIGLWDMEQFIILERSRRRQEEKDKKEE